MIRQSSGDKRTSLRVLQIVGTVGPAFGGPSHGLILLNKALRAAGVNASVLTVDYGDTSYRALTDDERRHLATTGADIQLHARSRPYRLQASVGLLLALFRQVPTADVIHMHGQYLFPHVASYLLARWFKVPYGIQLHGSMISGNRSRSWLRRVVSSVLRGSYNLLVGNRIRAKASYLMCTSEMEVDLLANALEKAKSCLIPLGVELDPPVVHDVLAARLRDVPRENCVLYLSRLAKFKHPELLLHAWAALARPDLRLVIAGPDGDLTRDTLEKLAVELDIANSVSFPGIVSGGHKTWLYQRCGLFVLPSESENFGIVIVEALISGCRIITGPQVAAGQHVVQADRGILLRNLSVQELAGVCASMLDEVARENNEDRVRGTRYATEHLSWTGTALALLEQFDKAQNR